MTARDLQTLLADGESEETIKDSIERLNDIETTSVAASEKLAAMREQLQQELQNIQQQGQLL